MNIKIREYRSADAKEASRIWNQVVEDGIAEDIIPHYHVL